MIGTTTQLGFLAIAAVLGFLQQSIWWLLPLTVCLGLVGWLTDRFWKVRFYDIYSVRDWLKFWLETLFGLVCFSLIAYVAGRLASFIDIWP